MSTHNLDQGLHDQVKQARQAMLDDVYRRLSDVNEAYNAKMAQIDGLRSNQERIRSKEAEDVAQLQQELRLVRQKADDDVNDVNDQIRDINGELDLLDEERSQLDGILNQVSPDPVRQSDPVRIPPRQDPDNRTVHVGGDPDPQDPPTGVLPPVDPAPQRSSQNSGSGLNRRIGLLLLILLVVFFGTLTLWDVISDHAAGDGNWANNGWLAFGIASIATVGAGFLLWPNNSNNSQR